MRARDANASRQRQQLSAALHQDRHLFTASGQSIPIRTAGGVKVVDRQSGQIKGELLKGRKLGQRFAWQRDPSSSAPL